MCGICGVYDYDNAIDHELFERMVDVVAYRGPDDRGTFYGEGIALGHRRLAIIDLSDEGHQPFRYRNRYHLVYNGEIYNYVELREQLQKKGYVFATKTDTEVLAAMYDCYGENCVKQMNGMWAFAVFDEQKKILFCSRDRFGIKPFYYYQEEKKLIFASEIKQIVLMAQKDMYVNRQRLLDFLIMGDLDHTEETMFRDIRQLRGGYNLIVDMQNGVCIRKKYYDLGETVFGKQSYKAACREFHKLFEKSVKLRLRADVPIGYCLSGGLDSSAIVCMADTILKSGGKEIKQHTISACCDDKEYDEQEYIDEVVRHTRVDAHKIFPKEEELFAHLDEIIWHMDEPFGSTSMFAQWNVFRCAGEQGLTVMLDGQGADEQLAGYTDFYSVALAHFLRHFRLLTFARELHAYCKSRRVSEKYVSAFDVIANAVVSAFVPDGLKKYVRRKLKYGCKDLPFPEKMIEETLQRRKRYDVGNPRQYSLDRMQCSMAALLHYEDRNSMAFSIESRVPFLDYRLAECIYSMPISYKVRNGMTKAVMRDGLTGILPDKIRHRVSKLGFVTPEDKWINNNFEKYRAEVLQACEQLKPVVNQKRVMEWFDKNAHGIKRGDYLAWRLICAGHWIQIYKVKFE